MVGIGGVFVIHHHRRRRIVQAIFNIVKTEDAAHFGHKETAVAEGHAVGHFETFGNDVHHIGIVVVVGIAEGIHGAFVAGAHKKRTVGRPFQRAGIGHVFGIHVYLKAFGQLDLAQRQLRSSPKYLRLGRVDVLAGRQ